MTNYNIAVIAGDGVGPEVIDEGKKALEAIGDPSFTFTDLEWSSDFYRKTGRFIPEGGLDDIRNMDAIYFGAVGDPDIQDHVTLNNLILPIRRHFDQYACVRPAYLYHGVDSPLVRYNGGDIDMEVVRENTRFMTPEDRTAMATYLLQGEDGGHRAARFRGPYPRRISIQP